MRLKENVGLAKVSKDDQGVVNPTYASAIRDIEKAEKKKAEFTKRQAEPKHDEKPKNPKMVSGAKKLHLDESLFEDSNNFEDVLHTYDGKLKEGDIYYTVTVFEEKGKYGKSLEPSSPEDAFDELYFTNPNDAQEYADTHYPDAYSIVIRENDWNEGLKFFWTSGPYLKRENGKWSKYSGKLSDARVGKTKEVKVLQGNYGYGWDDLCEYEMNDTSSKQDLKDYQLTEPGVAHRIIYRRVPIEK